jgi:hypothetical protein
MVLVEDARASAMSIGFSSGGPGQLDQPVEIGAHHAVFGRGAPACAAAGAAPCAPGSSTSSGMPALAIALRRARRSPAPCPPRLRRAGAGSRHLLAQQHLALALVERGLGLPADLLRQPQHLDAVRQQRETLSMRAARSTVSRISCFSGGLMSM